MIYDVNGDQQECAYYLSGESTDTVYDAYGNAIFLTNQEIEEELPNENQSTNVAWYINQIGYDVEKSKRATLTNGVRDTEFTLRRFSDDSVVYSGIIKNQIADFTEFNNAGEYYLQCGDVKSYDFKISVNRLWNVCALPSLNFMEQSRSDAWCVGNNGIGWRDSHQFSFELNTLVMLYMSNPTYYKSLPYNVYRVSECEYAELQMQNEPDIIWLMKFAVTRYYDWNTNDGVTLHALIKGQIAYFLYLYPHISEYIDSAWYETIRNWLIEQWSVETCNKSWFEVDGGINHNLFATQEKIGTAKGMLPPGYAIVPNLMMYEVAKRDDLSNAQDYFDAAYNNMEWLVSDIDLRVPAYTKGQRMSEHITFHSLCYFYEMYPDDCPPRTYNTIENITKTLISRSNNLWDFRQYQTNGDLSGATSTKWTVDGNEPGNVAGFTACAYALARVIDDIDVKKRLKEIAVSHIDNTFGRNPTGRCFTYNATNDFDGAKLGWFCKFGEELGESYIGPGVLGDVVGCLDGSPKEASYPYDPGAGAGYTEGWVAFNTAWNMSLAYLNGENSDITDGIGIFAK